MIDSEWWIDYITSKSAFIHHLIVGVLFHLLGFDEKKLGFDLWLILDYEVGTLQKGQLKMLP